MNASRRLELVVDPIACDGFGYCAELLPELVARDEWGYPLLEDRTVPPGLARLARRAVDACPRRALLLSAVVEGAHLGRGATNKGVRASAD